MAVGGATFLNVDLENLVVEIGLFDLLAWVVASAAENEELVLLPHMRGVHLKVRELHRFWNLKLDNVEFQGVKVEAVEVSLGPVFVISAAKQVGILAALCVRQSVGVSSTGRHLSSSRLHVVEQSSRVIVGVGVAIDYALL